MRNVDSDNFAVKKIHVRNKSCVEHMAKTQPDERPYHHGDLRRAIVKAALEILSETQSLDFSLRELARRAGVSHNAPYKHFTDKRELLAAVSAAGFEMLAKRMAREGAGARQCSQADVRDAACLHRPWRRKPGALQFDVRRLSERPGSRSPGHRTGRSRENQSSACRTSSLRAGSDAQFRTTPRNERKIAGAILACWSLVHGLTLLLADGLVGPRDKVRRARRDRHAGHARRIGGRIAGPAAWHLAWPSSTPLR